MTGLVYDIEWWSSCSLENVLLSSDCPFHRRMPNIFIDPHPQLLVVSVLVLPINVVTSEMVLNLNTYVDAQLPVREVIGSLHLYNIYVYFYCRVATYLCLWPARLLVVETRTASDCLANIPKMFFWRLNIPSPLSILRSGTSSWGIRRRH